MDESTPELSWKGGSEKRGRYKSAPQLIVAYCFIFLEVSVGMTGKFLYPYIGAVKIS